MKNTLRKQYLTLRQSKTEDELLQSSEKIIENLYKVTKFNNAKTIMVYVSFRGEVNTLPLIEELLRQNKRICVPLCNSKDCSMTAREIKNFDDLSSGNYGILEPTPSAPEIPANEIDFIIVPGCAFSENGHRIGYGKGYYDRFLKNTKATTCGLCYDFSLAETLPFEETDVPLDLIITQTRIITPQKA